MKNLSHTRARRAAIAAGLLLAAIAIGVLMVFVCFEIRKRVNVHHVFIDGPELIMILSGSVALFLAASVFYIVRDRLIPLVVSYVLLLGTMSFITIWCVNIPTD